MMSTTMLGIVGLIALLLLTCLTLVCQVIVGARLAAVARRATYAQDDDAYEIDGALFTAEEFARLMELHTAYQHTRTGGDAA